MHSFCGNTDVIFLCVSSWNRIAKNKKNEKFFGDNEKYENRLWRRLRLRAHFRSKFRALFPFIHCVHRLCLQPKWDTHNAITQLLSDATLFHRKCRSTSQNAFAFKWAVGLGAEHFIFWLTFTRTQPRTQKNPRMTLACILYTYLRQLESHISEHRIKWIV